MPDQITDDTIVIGSDLSTAAAVTPPDDYPVVVPPNVPAVVFTDPGFDADGVGYWGFGLCVTYQWDSGLRMAPKAAAARTAVAIWRAQSETSVKVIDMTATRQEDVPVLPALDTGDPNDVLLSVTFSMPARVYAPDGTPMVAVHAQYVYAQQMARQAAQPVVIPNHVLKVDAPLQLDPSAFVQLLHGKPNPPPDYPSAAAIAY